jgi:PAS domain S-box-containing protein
MSQTASRQVSRFARLQAWYLLLALAGTGLLISMAWQHFYSEARENAEADLAVIAELKARDVENWLRDKRNGALQPASGYLTTGLLHWQQAQRSPAADAALRERLAFYQQRHPEAIRVTLYDAQASFLISTDPAIHHDKHRLDVLRLNASPVINQSEILDFHFEARAGAHLAIISPLLDATPQGIRRVGYVLMELDPRRQLFRSIQRWPASSRSGESLLWQQQEDYVELVSPLRFEPDALPGKRLPLSDLQASPAQLAARQPVSTPGKDYRQVEVLRNTHPVAGTNWWIVTKIDAKEVFAPALSNSLKFSVLLLGLLALCCVLFIQNQRRNLNLASQRQAEAEEARLRAFIDAVPESLSMLHVDGQIIIANETAACRLGRSAAELVGQNIYTLLPPDLAASRQDAIREACGSNKIIALKDKRDGIEFLCMIYPLGDAQHVVIFATDITARSAAECARDAAINTLQSFIDHLPGTAFVKDHESRILIANQGFQTLLGLNPADMIGKLSSEIFPGEFGEKIVADDLRILAAGQTEVLAESFNGRVYESTKFVIPRDNAPPALGGITLDVTARHQAEAQLRESEERLRSLADSMPDGYLYQVVSLADGARQFTYLSSGVERIHGIPASDILADARRLYASIDPAQIPSINVEEARCHEEKRDFCMEFRARRADGQYGHCLVRSRPRSGPDGTLIWDGVVQDITAIKESERQLALQNQRAAALLELPDASERLDEAGFMSFAQDVAERLTGSQIAFIHFVHEDQEHIELVAWSHNTLAHYCKAAHDKHYPISQAGIWAEAARQEAPVVVNDYASAPGKRGLPEGHSHLQRLISVPVIEDGKVRMLAGVGNKVEDYTELDVESMQLIANETWRIVRKRRAERQVKQLAQVVEASPAVCLRWRPEPGWPVLLVSENVRSWGYSPEQLVSGEILPQSLIHPDDAGRCAAEVEGWIRHHIDEYAQEYRLRRSDASYLWIREESRLTRGVGGEVLHIDSVLNDISERKAHELQLADKLAAEQALSKRLEEAHNQLLQSEKLAAIGQLAAGVAHELNNPIGFVHSNLGTLTEYATALIELCDAYTTLIDDQHPECEQLAEIRRIKQDQDYSYLRGDIFPLLDESREGLVRVRKIVQDLRDFSRTGNQDWGLADLHKGLESTLNIVANELKYKCTVKKEYGELPEVMCVISQINQVFMNLLVNAAQAIETQGEIVLKSGMEDEEHVWISISDTGKGIEPEHLNRIFDPFFTTKPVGVGTGLGLSLVFGIINRHHGRIEVESEPGQGCTFRMLLPIRQYQETATSTPGEEKS